MKRFALVDCNNFFVSCERVFNPKLIGKPVVVLSSNDACVIARSNEAKALGIKMGVPAFQCKDIFKKYNVIVMSSNFALYGDMSSRVMQVVCDYSMDFEIYSVDEAFFSFNFAQDRSEGRSFDCAQDVFNDYAQFVRKKVKQKTGIPVSIGIGPTKTLAKVANKIAKKNKQYDGVFDITDQNIDDILEKIPVGDIWGIGYRYAKKLESVRILNAKDFKYANDVWVKKNLTVFGLRTMYELRGIPCLEIDEISEPKKSITVSRMFGRNVTDIEELKEAVASYVSCAAEKLRAQNSIASTITVFVAMTKYHDFHRFYNSSTYSFDIATSYTPDLIKAAHNCLQNLYKPGLIYKKAGVIITNIIPADFIQMNLYKPLGNTKKQKQISQIMDNVNEKWGRNMLRYAAVGTNQSWKMKQLKKSQCYTTSWHEILTIKI